MGQRHSASLPPKTCKSRFSLSPDPRNQSPPKSSLIQKITQFISMKKIRAPSMHLPNPSIFSTKSELKAPLQRKKQKPDVKHNSFSTFTKIDEVSKMKTRLSGRMSTKDFSLKRQPTRRVGAHRMSLFESMGISQSLSPTSPENKRRKPTINMQEFSILDNKIHNIYSKKENKKSFDEKASHENSLVKSPLKAEKPLEIPHRITTEKENNTSDISSEGKTREKETVIFKSPLIKGKNTVKKPSPNVASMLVSNYSEYLRKKKIKQISQKGEHEAHPMKKKAMKQLLNSHPGQDEFNMNDMEFEIKNAKDDTKKDEFTEMMDYYRKEKFRQDLFANKIHGVDPISLHILNNNTLNKPDNFNSGSIGYINPSIPHSIQIIRGNSMKKLTKLVFERSKQRMETLSPFEMHYTGGVPTRNSMITPSIFNFESNNSKGFLSDSRMNGEEEKCEVGNICGRSNTRLVFSQKMKEKIKENNKIENKIEINNPNSKEGIAKEKPIKVCKNKKKLIFFKNRIIEIENDESRNSFAADGENPKEDSLFLKIIKNGNTPTKFFLRKEHGKSST